MRPGSLTWPGTIRGLAVLVVLGACGLRGVAAPAPARKDPPKHLPQEVVRAWKKAGAIVGWMRVDKHDFLLLRPEEEGGAGGLPAFRIPFANVALLAKLPAPA